MTVPRPAPQWTALSSRRRRGRDHLGLGEVAANEFFPELSPGVNALTYHPRYHSFYTFLLDEFWARELSRDWKSWASFYRPREWAFSLAAHFCTKPEHGEMFGVVGSGRTAPQAHAGGAAFVYDPDYIKQSTGGYGLYYRTVIMGLGLALPGGLDPSLPVDGPNESGRRLAAAFRSAVSQTEYYRSYFEEANPTIPQGVLEEYADKACLCQAMHESASDRLPLLDGMLHAGDAGKAAMRRLSFRLFLDIASQTDGKALSASAFRELLFFGGTGTGAAYAPRPDLDEHYRAWRFYQAREYYTYALNALWSDLCRWGQDADTRVEPVRFDALWRHVDEGLDFAALAGRVGLPDPGLGPISRFGELLDWLDGLVGHAGDEFDQACGLESALQESALMKLRSSSTEPCIAVAGMLCLLTLTYLRFSPPNQQAIAGWRYARKGGWERLSIARFVRDLRERLHAEPTIREVAHWLLREYVIRQHIWVALRKLPDDTLRFRYDGTGLRFFDLGNDFSLTDSRFDSMGMTVHELGLCGRLYNASHPLTPGGERLLEDGDLQCP